MFLNDLARFVLGQWWAAFLLTHLIEIPIYAYLSRKSVPLWRAVWGGALCSCLTHPFLWFVWSKIVRDHLLYLASGELIVALTESLVFFAVARPIRFWQAVSVAFLANATSFGVGLIIASWK